MEKIITCVAVDDEEPALNLVEQFVSRTPALKLLAKFRNPLQAAEWLNLNKTDLLLLDIQMPQQSGIEMIQKLQHKPVVIFTTAFTDFAAEAFDLDAADYLRKPFSYDRFMKAVQKAKDYLSVSKKPADYDMAASPDNFITIKADGKILKILIDEIIYAEGYQEYIKLYTLQERYITYERMKNLEAMLPAEKFMRVHKSYIVALRFIKSIAGNLLDVEGHQIPVSRDVRAEILRRVFGGL
jgi:DNA-binding LytR/AlgR family response regulator